MSTSSGVLLNNGSYIAAVSVLTMSNVGMMLLDFYFWDLELMAVVILITGAFFLIFFVPIVSVIIVGV